MPWYGEATSRQPITTHISRKNRCASAARCWSNIGAPALSFQRRAALTSRLSTHSSCSSSSQTPQRWSCCLCCHMSAPVVFHSGKRCAGRPVAVPILQFHAMGIHVRRGHEADVNGLRLHAIRLPRCGGVQYASTQEAPRNARPRRTTRVRRSTLTRSGEYERRINRPLNANLSLVLETRPSRTAKWPEYTFSSLYDSSRSAS